MGAHPKTQSQNTNVQEYKEGHEMKILLGAMLLLIVGCTGVAHAERSATTDTEDRIAALEEHVTILYEEAVVHEQHILALEANDEAKVVQVVKDRLWERVTSCNLDEADCFDGEAMLWAFKYLPMSHYDKVTYVMALVGGGYWWGEQESTTTWRVYAHYDDNTDPVVFLVDATYGLMCWEGLTDCLDVADFQ